MQHSVSKVDCEPWTVGKPQPTHFISASVEQKVGCWVVPGVVHGDIQFSLNAEGRGLIRVPLYSYQLRACDAVAAMGMGAQLAATAMEAAQAFGRVQEMHTSVGDMAELRNEYSQETLWRLWLGLAFRVIP